ncbi:MAG: hypothetical protein AB7F75_07665 [Planctomycetota bacterium]
MNVMALLKRILGMKEAPPQAPKPATPPPPLTESQKVRAEELKDALEREAMSGVRWIDKKK